ncbi:iron-containing alcohol dehydrogenase [Bacillus sp. EB106-08-02-XG196]|uniref:iron-containing alcohol dehydrogenase n=1 Tax=Bacillus sp. EB106-08-02-XG196 TaxID=2737049 RepID=UPI0015C467EC|nr:iron-containing alcohol dehydrogenase [Bacillus sp. EB106-08-02-XG196]NWQ43753.1 iron-containing alcohol dehydrogenase [Bacillus sp. EB106-08-02-XG196]
MEKVLEKTLQGNFLLLPMNNVVFGENSVEQLPQLLAINGIKNPYIITGNTLANKTPLVERLKNIIGVDNVAGVYSECKAHVPKRMVLDIAEDMRKTNADGIISFGGGSPVDAAKSVAMVLAEEIHSIEKLNEYPIQFNYQTGELTFRPLSSKPLPHIAITTTLSAGEFTHIAGMTDEVTKVKVGAIDPQLTPVAVIHDPVLTLHTPDWLWLSTGIRAVDHAVESICSNDHMPFTDALGKEALRLLTTYLPKCKEDPTDLNARSYCQMGAWLSISGLANVNLGLSHGIGHQLGGRCGVPHGVTSCVMLPTVMEYNLDVTKERQAMIARVIGAANYDENDEIAASKAAPAIREFIKNLDLPWRLRDTVVETTDFDALAKDALEDFIVATNPRKINGREDVIELLEKAW